MTASARDVPLLQPDDEGTQAGGEDDADEHEHHHGAQRDEEPEADGDGRQQQDGAAGDVPQVVPRESSARRTPIRHPRKGRESGHELFRPRLRVLASLLILARIPRLRC
jgi:hypothetical protein